MAGFKLKIYPSLDSTQSKARKFVDDNKAIDRMAIMAEEQTRGRGRYKRQWISPKGNLYISLLYKMEERSSLVAYAIAVAVAEVVDSFGIDSMIKWPNDVLVKGKKISGILIEHVRDFVIIGIGVNVVSSPAKGDIVKYDTTYISKYSKNVKLEDVLTKLLDRVDFWMNKLKSKGFDPIRREWMLRADFIGHTVKYQGHEVILCGINDDGVLVLRRGADYMLVYGDEITV